MANFPQLNKFIKNKKGFSGILAIIFLVLIVLFLVFNVYMYKLDRDMTYEDSKSQSAQTNIDSSGEKVLVFAEPQIPIKTANEVTVNYTLNNTSPLPVHLIRLWVRNTDNNEINSTETSIILNPGDIIEDQSQTVPIQNSNLGDNCTFWFVTSRGNIVSTKIPDKSTTMVSVGGIGSVMMNFDDFKYYHIQQQSGQYRLTEFPTGASGFSIDMLGQPIGFRVKLTNLDPQGRTVVLNSESVLFSLFPVSPQQPRGDFWYIIIVDPSTGAINPTFNPVVLTYGEEISVYFASENPMTGGFDPVEANNVFAGTSPVNLALIGTVGTERFGQNLPFVAIYIN